MASAMYNTALLGIWNGSIDLLNDTIKIALIGTSTPYSFDKDHTSMTTPAASEVVVSSGYQVGFSGTGRKTLSNKSVTKDNTNDRVVFDADDPSAWTLASGDTVASAIVYKHDTNDATSIPIAFLDGSDVATNGGTITVTYPATGICYAQQ